MSQTQDTAAPAASNRRIFLLALTAIGAFVDRKSVV